MKVWDALIRSLHWLLAASVLIACASGQWPGRWFDEIHHSAGYVAGGAVLIRLIWGFSGGRYARFTQFIRSPRATWAYARQLSVQREPRYIGHNPLGGWMVLALLTTAAASSLTGILYISEWLWGYAWLSDLHATLAWLIVLLVIGHWAGVGLSSWRHRENLVSAMLTGHKRAAERSDIA